MNPKQRTFCEEYLIDLNATQAAIRAGYSEKTAGAKGHELLKIVEVAEYIDRLKEERSQRTQITSDRVLNELAKLGFGNIRNLYSEEGKLLHPQDLPPDVSATIHEVTEEVLRGAVAKDDGGEDVAAVVLKRKYKVADKKSSLELLGKHLKLFTDKVEHVVSIEDLSDEQINERLKQFDKG